ncbi:hypothetical protein SAMN05216229_10230 [Geopseudomonas sagittaria]|uniref:Uncharacterized protein n=1 Tax=Geopseudomonas sagittaria TaxID=1135990 RepID=A0A1I5PTE8_9GAMM|nr:hypothetical protein [Pseudomonas sagittaria]SFP37358.1 hypothetical protein SAMN05216229_10230 [Pseudomonas sagittaria]
MSDMDHYDEDLELNEDEQGLDPQAQRQAAYQEAVTELAKGIALGAVPFLGQAIDAYDTVESAIRVYQSKTTSTKEEAQFDLVLAIIGWIPGPGDGVKKSLRLVNRDPERFAPVLFDFLRFVLEECGIRTSPEELLAKIFDADALRTQLDEIIEGVRDSGAFEALPSSLQHGVIDVLVIARDNLSSMLGIVERRLLKWRSKQRNSSATVSDNGQPAVGIKPRGEARDNADGKDTPSHSGPNRIDTQQTRTYPIEGIDNAILSVAGEHIADYYCYEQLGWGSGWEAHDLGGAGQWTGAKPSALVAGKLSRGGSPKDHQKLFKLTDPSFGTGIDAVWCATGCANNDGKPFAIVDAKASISSKNKKPKYMSRPGNTRKPGISRLLEGSGSGHNRVVQMSHEWIYKNIYRAIPPDIARKVLKKLPDGAWPYDRHVFYTPTYSDSLLTHLGATFENGAAELHDEHAAIHYPDGNVKNAVNKAKLRERKTGKYPGAKGLDEEKQ